MNKIRHYKGIAVNSFGIPIWDLKKYKKKHQKLENPKYTKRVFHSTFLPDVDKDSPKNLIVMYDIPSDKRKERDWFRRHLKKFNYVMIQKSVWVGPSPLPKDFIEYVKSIGLKDQLKIFKLAKPYTGKGNNI